MDSEYASSRLVGGLKGHPVNEASFREAHSTTQPCASISLRDTNFPSPWRLPNRAKVRAFESVSRMETPRGNPYWRL